MTPCFQTDDSLTLSQDDMTMADSFKSVSPASAVTFNEDNLSVGSAGADFDPSQLPESKTGRRRLMSRDVFCMVSSQTVKAPFMFVAA